MSTGNESEPDSLEKIATEVISCTKCRLSDSRINAVPGEGSAQADLLIIGEAPGKYEDKFGRPFIGAAGKILDTVLKKAGIRRDDVFITNIVKCRPPNNRIPQDDERSACRPYLDRQIAILRPKIICIMGNTAYSSMLGGKSIIANRGKVIERNGQKYFLTIHPAAAIYNKNLLSTLVRDMTQLSKELNRIKDQRVSSLDKYVL